MTANEALERGRAEGYAPSLTELGGPAGIRTFFAAGSAGHDLPLLVPALVEAGADEPDLTATLVNELRDCNDPATFGAAVAALPREIGHVADSLVPALLTRVLAGTDSPAAAHIAARATITATAVALASRRSLPAARVALALADAAPTMPDTVAQAAVRSAGALIDALPQDGAVREGVVAILDNLAERNETEVEVALERAHLRLADALGEADYDRVCAGLAEAQQLFDDVLTMETDRIDAEIVSCALGAVLTFAASEPVTDLVVQIEALCDERTMYSVSTIDHISRRPAEDAWRLLARSLAFADGVLDDTAWLDPIAALTLLTDAVRLSRVQTIGGADLSVLIMPRVRAPFLEGEHLRALLRRYVETLVDEPQRAEVATELLLAAEAFPKVDGSEPDAHLLRALQDTGLDEAQAEVIVATRDALSNAANIHRGRQWCEAYARAASALVDHPDANTRVGQAAKTVLIHVLDFIADRFNMTRGARPHLQYLVDPNALEQELADDLVNHLRYWFGDYVRTEISDVGGGRVDVVIDLGDDRIVIECKRDADPWAAGTLEGWAMQADAYLATGTRIGLLVLLDLSEKSQGRPTDLAGSVKPVHLQRTPVDHLVICAVVPGNQSTPSSIGAAARAAARRNGRGLTGDS